MNLTELLHDLQITRRDADRYLALIQKLGLRK